MENKVENLQYKFKKMGSLPYLIYAVVCTFILLLFINSNSLLNKDFNMESTELNKKMYLNNSEISMVDRKYNQSTGYIQFNLKIKNRDLKQNNMFKAELREKKNPTKIIPLNLVKITSEDYIFYTTLQDLKWEAVSLTLTNNSNETANNKLNKDKIRFYTSIKDIELNNVNETDIIGYSKDILDQTIKLTQKNIDELQEDIKDKTDTITNLKNNIKSLESEQEFQTESEKSKSNSAITSAKTQIQTLENNINLINKNCKELEDKIKKLEQKKDKMN